MYLQNERAVHGAARSFCYKLMVNLSLAAMEKYSSKYLNHVRTKTKSSQPYSYDDIVIYNINFSTKL